MICVKCHTLNISLTFSPVHCKTALSLPQSTISLCAGWVWVQERGHKGVGHTKCVHWHATHRVCPILERIRARGRRGGADDMRPFDPQLHFIYEYESCNFFSLRISISFFFLFPISSQTVFFSSSSPREPLVQTGRLGQMDGQRDGQFV